MAGLVRLRNMHRLVSQLNLAPKPVGRMHPSSLMMLRAVGTSGTQKSESIAAKVDTDECKPAKKPWVSYGYCFEDQDLDKHLMNLTFFIGVSIVLVYGSWLLIYLPDFRMRDWTQREAYLELRRRESLGLPLIDPNLVDPAKMKLPTDEELGDREIII